MKITINGSPKELAEFLDALGGMENAEKKHELPPLLTDLAENKNTNLFFGDAHGQTGDEFAETIRRNRETISIIKKMNEVAKQRKETAPQAETAELKKNQKIFEKQMKLLSEASEFCTGDLRFPQNLSELTRAMIDLHKYQGRLS